MAETPELKAAAKPAAATVKTAVVKDVQQIPVQTYKATKSAAASQVKIFVLVGAATGVVFVARLVARPGDVLLRPGQMVRIAFGGAVVTVMLMVGTLMSPDLAEAMAWLVLIGSLFAYGRHVGDAISRLAKPGGITVTPETAVDVPSSLSGNVGPAVMTA